MVTDTVLVTGAAGFIGSTLSTRLLHEGHHVIGLDSLTDYYDPSLKRSNLRNLVSNKNFTMVEKNISEVDFLSGEFASVSHIAHLAGQPGVRSSWGAEFDIYTQANIKATQILLEFAAHHTLTSFVYASSSSVYGNAEAYPTSEGALPQPYSPYGVTKLAGEHLCGLYAKNYSVPTRSLRFFTVYGPRQRPDMAFTRFFQMIREGKPIPIYGDGSQVREFTYVDDVVDAVYRSLFADIPNGTVMNVSGGSSVSLMSIVETMRHELDLDVKTENLPRIPGDVLRTGGTTELISSLTNWSPKYSLEEGLKRQWEWARDL